jgi:hypothetical protein
VNNTDKKVEIEKPVLKITEVEPETLSEPPADDSTGPYVYRPGEVLKQLRLGDLNEEERRDRKT